MSSLTQTEQQIASSLEKDGLKGDIGRNVKPAAVARFSIGNPAKDPYMLVVTKTRNTNSWIPEGLLEIQVIRSPLVGAKRAEDVIRHALIDQFGPNCPVYTNGVQRAVRWFDHLGPLNKQINKGRSESCDSLWMVMDGDFSYPRVTQGAMAFLGQALYNFLLERHKSLPSE